MTNKDILTEDERKALKSMAIYWKEVRGREDQTPLYEEAVRISRILGIRVLDIAEEYIEVTEHENK